MRICDIPFEQIKVGMRVMGVRGRAGTVVEIDNNRDDYVWILWDGAPYPYSGWYGNDCELEIIEE